MNISNVKCGCATIGGNPRLQYKTPDDGQRNCLKHAEFYSKNKFEKLVHLVGFVIRITYSSTLSVASTTQLQIRPRDTGRIAGIILNIVFNLSHDIYEKSLINESYII